MLNDATLTSRLSDIFTARFFSNIIPVSGFPFPVSGFWFPDGFQPLGLPTPHSLNPAVFLSSCKKCSIYIYIYICTPVVLLFLKPVFSLVFKYKFTERVFLNNLLDACEKKKLYVYFSQILIHIYNQSCRSIRHGR